MYQSSSSFSDDFINAAAAAVRSSSHRNRNAVAAPYYSGPQEEEAALPSAGSLVQIISSPPGLFSQLIPHHINAGTGDLGAESSSSSWGNSNCISFAANGETEPAAPPTHHHVDANAANFTTCTHLETDQYLSMSGTDWLQLHNAHDQDSVPCKLRAKRGFATHPRSIAERERRIKISGKLKKLQELVPNMDKQSGYADMLDLAVDHIKGLQKEVQKLEKGLEKCSCGSNNVR